MNYRRRRGVVVVVDLDCGGSWTGLVIFWCWVDFGATLVGRWMRVEFWHLDGILSIFRCLMIFPVTDGMLVLGGDFDNFLLHSGVYMQLGVANEFFNNCMDLGDRRKFERLFPISRCWANFWTLLVGWWTGTRFQHSGCYVGFCGARCVFGTIV